jgi:(2Fe-2S) ferredoxin
MKLDIWQAISSLLEAGGTFQNDRYEVRASNGHLHRGDGPAVVYPDGTQHWYRNGALHRGDGPAIILPHGTKSWYRNGLRHRDDGPAIIYPDGTQEWYRDGNRHWVDK